MYGDVDSLPTGVEREGCRATMTIAVIRYGRIALLSVYLNIYAKSYHVDPCVAELKMKMIKLNNKANLQCADNMLFIWQNLWLTIDSLFSGRCNNDFKGTIFRCVKYIKSYWQVYDLSNWGEEIYILSVKIIKPGKMFLNLLFHQLITITFNAVQIFKPCSILPKISYR